jgi:hypothetical protein
MHEAKGLLHMARKRLIFRCRVGVFACALVSFSETRNVSHNDFKYIFAVPIQLKQKPFNPNSFFCSGFCHD